LNKNCPFSTNDVVVPAPHDMQEPVPSLLEEVTYSYFWTIFWGEGSGFYPPVFYETLYNHFIMILHISYWWWKKKLQMIKYTVHICANCHARLKWTLDFP